MKFVSLTNYPNYAIGGDYNIYSMYKGEPRKIGSLKKDGHTSICVINEDGERHTSKHVLIAEQFVHNDDPFNKTVVHHKDGDPTNDNPSNLTWMELGTHRELHMKGKNNPNYGKHLSEETRRRLSEANKGKHPSDGTRRRLSEANKGEKNPMYGKKVLKVCRYVEQWSLSGEFMGRYVSTRDAERETGVHHTSISACCRGERKTAGGYIWK